MADGFQLKNAFFYEGGWHTRPMENPAIFDQMKTMTLNSDDVILATYRKAGSTWVSAILDLIYHPENLAKRDEIKLGERVRLIDICLPFRNPKKSELEFALDSKSPRLMLTHLPCQVFEKQINNDKAKVVLVLRNPKDTLVSYFHFYRSVRGIYFPDSWPAFFEEARAKKLVGGDFFEYYQGWLTQKDKPNVYVMTFEDLKAKPDDEVRKLAHFLGKPLNDDVIKGIVQHTTFDKMKDNPAVNHRDNRAFDQSVSKFMRKGQVGDWESYFTSEQNEHIEQRCREMAAGQDAFEFKYSL